MNNNTSFGTVINFFTIVIAAATLIFGGIHYAANLQSDVRVLQVQVSILQAEIAHISERVTIPSSPHP